MQQTKLDYETPTKRTGLSDDWAYMLPMFTFLGFLWIGGQWKSLYPLTYVARCIVTATLLVVFWHRFTKVRWNHWWLGFFMGIVGFFQWVPMQLWLQNHVEFFKPSGEVFNPFEFFKTETTAIAFIIVRVIGAVLIVPVMEELFWRDYLWRTIIAPNDFKLAQVGERDWKAVLIVAGAFATVHGGWWLTAIPWALMIAAVLIYTRSIGACIIMHATTNLMLAIYVLMYKDWGFW